MPGGLSDQRVWRLFAFRQRIQVVEGGFRDADQRLGGKERLMPGKEHVMAGGEAAEDVILNHIVRLVFKEEIALVLIYVHTQGADFLCFQRLDGRLGIDQTAAAEC